MQFGWLIELTSAILHHLDLQEQHGDGKDSESIQQRSEVSPIEDPDYTAYQQESVPKGDIALTSIPNQRGPVETSNSQTWRMLSLQKGVEFSKRGTGADGRRTTRMQKTKPGQDMVTADMSSADTYSQTFAILAAISFFGKLQHIHS